jgi:hypothetical protein
MTDTAEATRSAYEYPDGPGYPDGKDALSDDRIVVIDEAVDDPHIPRSKADRTWR